MADENNNRAILASGSGRRPGHWNGCYAMRPSHGMLPVDGYIPSFRLVAYLPAYGYFV